MDLPLLSLELIQAYFPKEGHVNGKFLKGIRF
jgi:hypothetical protein